MPDATPHADKDEPKLPPQVEEELAALFRPTSAEELFGTVRPAPGRQAALQERLRQILTRHGLDRGGSGKP
jgi:hypothetical protein